MRGVQCEPRQVIPITSLESALDLTARVLLDPGHSVLIEEPSTFGAWEIFKAAGARVFPLPADRAGADPARAEGPPPRLIFVSPSVGFPLGSQMSEQRRLALLEVCTKRLDRTSALPIWSCRPRWLQFLRKSPPALDTALTRLYFLLCRPSSKRTNTPSM
jgi:DNA-binding transcriptional MocR family regulator